MEVAAAKGPRGPLEQSVQSGPARRVSACVASLPILDHLPAASACRFDSGLDPFLNGFLSGVQFVKDEAVVLINSRGMFTQGRLHLCDVMRRRRHLGLHDSDLSL